MKIYPYNEDTGDINMLYDTNFFIIGMSKCGTTTLQHSFRAPVIKYHSDYTLERVYDTKELTTKLLLNERKKIDTPFYIFISYRNPIERKISQYYQYINLENKSNDTKIKEIKEFCLGDYSLLSPNYRTEVDEELVYKNIIDSTGVNIFDYKFNKELGYIHIQNGILNLVPFTLFKLHNLEKYIIKNIDTKFSLTKRRITEDVNGYYYIKNNIKFTPKELDKIYNNKYCTYFYTDKQIKIFKEKYLYG